MDLYYDRAEIQINLNYLKNNIEELNKNLTKGTDIIAVVKTDAYGHGASAIARFLEPLTYIWGFAVATVEEGVTLRREGITKPILVLGATFPREIRRSVSYNLTSNIFDLNTAKAISHEGKIRNKNVAVHLSVDTGMGRIGFRNNEKDINTIKEISKLPNLDIQGMFTHFARADEFDVHPTEKQLDYYEKFASKLAENGIKPRIKHLANSAGIINGMGKDFDLVRAGIAMYGIYPSDEVYKERADLKQILSLKSKIIFVKDVEKGETISYGGCFVANNPMKVATIPIGYGDGYPRELSSKGYVLIKGKKAKILGRVCMDQFMVDVTDIEDVKIGNIVTLIGKDGDYDITVDKLAEMSGRFNYELVCDLNKRIPRCYYIDGKRIEEVDYFYN